MSIDNFKTSRRAMLQGAGTAIAGLVLPGAALGQSPREITIVQASASVLISWAPSFIAEDLGYYKEEGLSLRRIPNGSGPGALTALFSGSVNELLAPPGELLTAASRGQKFKILAAESNYLPNHFVISKDYAAKFGITKDTPFDKKREIAKKNFKGIRIGITAPNSLTDLTARISLQVCGLDPATDAQIVPLGSVPNAVAAMTRGNIDGYTGASPAPETSVHELGAVILFSTGKNEMGAVRDLAGHLIIARAQDTEQDPGLFAAIVRADTRGLRYIVENPAAASENLYKHRYASLPKELWSLIWELNASQFKTPLVKKESVEAWITIGAVPGVTDPKKIDVGEIVDMRFVNQALQKIGWKAPAP